MSYHPRRILTPGASRKRKEREAFYASTSSKPSSPVTVVSLATTSSKGTELQPQPPPPPPQPLSSNRLLAGYMAYEFLTKGTLFGQKFDPGRAEAVPLSSAELMRNKPNTEAEPSKKSKPQSYAEVADLMMSDGAHIPGIVNPTQLARWIQM